MDTVQHLFTFKLDNVSGKNHGKGKPRAGKRITINDKLLCVRSMKNRDWTAAFTTREQLTITWNECSFIGTDGTVFIFMRRGELVPHMFSDVDGLEFFLDDIA